LTEQQTGLSLSKIGSREFLEKLLHSVAYREGFGDILAEGIWRARERVSPEVRARFSSNVAPVGQQDLAPARAFVVNALLYPLEPRVHQPLIHETSFLMAAWNMNRLQPGSTPVTGEVFHRVAGIFWGSQAAGDVSTYEGKALAAKKIQDRTYIKDSLGLCDSGWPITYSFNTADNVGDPDLEARIFTAVTGLPGEELAKSAERISNLQRVILLQEGRAVPEADYPPAFNFTEPLKANARGQPMMVPGPGNDALSSFGNVLSKERFAGMLQEYYRLRGWDSETGIPLRQTLVALNMEDVASRLALRLSLDGRGLRWGCKQVRI
jgi:aldehyde:ferredoxin oxidoreductase